MNKSLAHNLVFILHLQLIARILTVNGKHSEGFRNHVFVIIGLLEILYCLSWALHSTPTLLNLWVFWNRCILYCATNVDFCCTNTQLYCNSTIHMNMYNHWLGWDFGTKFSFYFLNMFSKKIIITDTLLINYRQDIT